LKLPAARGAGRRACCGALAALVAAAALRFGNLAALATSITFTRPP
jgi:hypothetical protein